MKKKNGGAAIYKAHPGLKCIALTDHASGKWFFNQPDTVLDRQVSYHFCCCCCVMHDVMTHDRIFILEIIGDS